MLGKFNSFIEKWMAFVTPVCLLTGVFFRILRSMVYRMLLMLLRL